MISALLGSLVYRVAIALALGLRFGDFAFTPSDLNLVTAALVVLALVSPRLKSKFVSNKRAAQ
jgi:putative ABC transport system permease protein